MKKISCIKTKQNYPNTQLIFLKELIIIPNIYGFVLNFIDTEFKCLSLNL